jgi:hypothetical protein
VEARSRGPKGETLEGGKARRGSTDGSRVTPAHRERIFRMHKSLELWRGAPWRRRAEQQEGQARREAWRLPGGETL